MFHLPKEIIQLIFEFDPTYKQEYNKVLQILNNFPVYYKHDITLVGEPYIYIYMFSYFPNLYNFDDLHQYSAVPHYYPPNKYYFYLLRGHSQLFYKY
jgi:hypothetical protein